MQNNANQELYELLLTHDFEPVVKDKHNNPIEDGSKGEVFIFKFKTANRDYGTVVILLKSSKEMLVMFGDNFGRSMEGDDKTAWLDFLEQLKHFAVSHGFMDFNIENINKLKFTMQGMAAIQEGLFEGFYGKKRISYSDQPKQVRLMIKHNRDLGEGEARHKAIDSIFVETSEGERFKVPTRSLMHGRMLARHVCEGGSPHDVFGQHINNVISEMGTLARFIRATRGRQFDESTMALTETAIRHYQDLKAKAKRMLGQRGYFEERESFDPAAFTESEVVVDTIREMFIEQTVDQRIEEALPYLAKIQQAVKEDDMKEVNEFESWADGIAEGTWALPDTPDQQKELQQLMSKPMIVGADGTNATAQLYDLVGDDILFDRLNDLADRDASANVWDDPAIMNRLRELGVEPVVAQNTQVADESFDDTVKKVGGAIAQGASKVFDKLGGGTNQELLDKLRKDAGLPPRMATPNEPKKQDFEEDLDTDGVMMTKPSNMSS
jgi:hypothetical protein